MRGSSPAVGGGLVLLGIAAGASALLIPLGSDGGWGARLFPMIAAGTLAMTGVAEALVHPGARRPAPSADAPHEGEPLMPVLLIAILAVVYVWLMGRVGYLISTAAVVPPALWLFGIRRPAALLAAAVALPLALHFAFFRALGVFPPLGRWVDLLDLVPAL